jgi:hypothetical protein
VLSGNGYCRSNRSPRGAGINFKSAAKLSHSFIHAAQTHPERSWPSAVRFLKQIGWKSFALIFDFQDCGPIQKGQTDAGRKAARVPVHVRQAFLQDAEQSQFGVAV